MATERQIPGGPYLNETGTRQTQIPGGPYVNETVSAGGSFTATGALAATAATIAGTATHLTLHPSSGALAAQAAAVAGSATHLTLHTSSGALVAQDAVVAGSANHVIVHTSSGALVAQDATVAGSADHTAPGSFAASGALSSDAATLSGAAVHYTLHTATGAIAADAATVAGSAQHLTLHTSTGDLVAGSATVDGVSEHTGDGATPEAPAVVGGGGWAWAAPRKSRYSYLPRETREQMAERVRKQREALGILPKRAQKRIESAVAKEARRTEPSLAPLAPVAAEIAQDNGIALRAVINAIRATYENQRGLVLARMQADMALRAEAQRVEAEQQRAAAEVSQREWQQRLKTLVAADDELLKQDQEARQQAIATIRQTQKALLALLG